MNTKENPSGLGNCKSCKQTLFKLMILYFIININQLYTDTENTNFKYTKLTEKIKIIFK